jgi:hypothetical protein
LAGSLLLLRRFHVIRLGIGRRHARLVDVRVAMETIRQPAPNGARANQPLMFAAPNPDN